MMPCRRQRSGTHHRGFAQLRVRERLPKESLCDGNDTAVNYSCLITAVNNLALNYLGIYFVNYDNLAHRCVLFLTCNGSDGDNLRVNGTNK